MSRRSPFVIELSDEDRGRLEVRTVSAVCTHLGGVVQRNQAEGSWDCPLHGSRFCNDGEMLHGPATKDLPARDGST